MKAKMLPAILFAALLVWGGVAAATDQDDGERALTVEIVNQDGRPVKNACVTFVPKSGEVVFRNSDRRGKVKLKKLAPGSYRVVVKADGYVAQKKEVEVRGEPETVAFSMHAPREHR